MTVIQRLKQIFYNEADRIQRTALALVHGDWSAKNFLVSKDRIIILDWEVAWFGDPAFDAAFFLNLIYLKSLLRFEKLEQFVDLMRSLSYCLWSTRISITTHNWSKGFSV